MNSKRVHIIGAGSWGTALAQAAAIAGNDVLLVARDAAIAAEISQQHTNERYLGSQELSERIMGTVDVSLLVDADIVLLAVPAQATRATLEALPARVKKAIPVLVTAKGFERGSLALQSEIVQQCWGLATPLVMSGPSFAADVAAGRPTALTLAGDDKALVTEVAKILSGPSFRLYGSSDRLGVELSGGLKNVYALACGAVEGAELGLSARSALIARAHVEMTRLIVAKGGLASTSVGLAGLGDLALSCTSPQSRNYRFGLELGKGRAMVDILASELGLAEGVATTPVALALCEKAGVSAPLIGAVNLLLSGKVDIKNLVEALMARPLKREE